MELKPVRLAGGVILILIAATAATAGARYLWDENELTALATAFQATLALLGGVFVFVEYCRSKESDRSQLAQELVNQMSEDPLLRFAGIVLDWGVGLIPVPPEWQSFVGAPHVAFAKAAVEDALTPNISETTTENTERLIYRHAFVRLFDHFERIQQLIETGGLQVEDFPNLLWVASKIKHPDYVEQHTFTNAMDRWYPAGAPQKFVEALLRLDGKRGR